MNSDGHAVLADVVRLVLGDNVFGLRMGMPLEATADGASPVPQFEQKVWFQRVQNDKLSPIPADLLNALNDQRTKPAVLIDTFLTGDPQAKRRLVLTTERGLYRADGAVIHHVLSEFPVGTTVAFLSPASVTSAHSFEELRADIDAAHGISWLIFADGRLLPGVHQSFHFVLLVVVVGTGPSKVTRLVNLRGTEASRWTKEIEAARNRGGGEVESSVVLRDVRLGRKAWSYERWTTAFSHSRIDSVELGELRPLRQFVQSVMTGLLLARETPHLLPVGDEEIPPPGFIAVIGGREVRAEGIALPGRYWVKRDPAVERLMVSEGDLLLRSIVSSGPHGPKIICAAVPSGVEAIPSQHVLRLRWNPEVSRQARELVTSWLASSHASKSLAAMGVAMHLAPSSLVDLEVPTPSDAIVAALERLGALEDWYRARAEAVCSARRAIFSAQRYAEAVPELLHTERVEGERVAAAEDSQRFAYRVRNYFPHPIALRWERLQVHEHGKVRLEETLECAEHLVQYLALCGLVQLGVLYPSDRLPSKHLRSIIDGDALRFSWGSSWSVFKEAVEATGKHKKGLLSPIPQLALLSNLDSPNSAASAAEAELRHQRNAQSHLHRVPEAELVTMSRRLAVSLDELLKAVAFVGDIPLAYVRDYALDGFTGERRVVLDLLRGASVVFDRSIRVVDRELPRESLGILGHTGEFHALIPWLLLHTCEVCKRPEVFVFNRCKGQSASFVAMETGHSWSNENMGGMFSKILARSAKE